MNNNTWSVHAVNPHLASPPVVQRDTNPEAEPYSANASYPVESAPIPPPSSYYDELFNEFIQLPNEDKHGVLMLATSNVNEISTVNHDNVHGNQQHSQIDNHTPVAGSGEPTLAIFSPSGIMSQAEIEELDFVPYSETIPGWGSVDVTFNGFAALSEANDSSMPQDHQLSDIRKRSPAGPALPPTVNRAHISATTPTTIASDLAATAPVPQSTSTTLTQPSEIDTRQATASQSTSSTQNLILGSVSIAISNNTGNITIHTLHHQPPLSLAGTVQTAQPYAQAGAPSTGPAPSIRATIVQPDPSVKAGTLVQPRALNSGSPLLKKKRSLLSSSVFTSTPLKQSWTPEGEVFPSIDDCTTHGPGAGSQPASKVSACESHSIIKDHPGHVFAEAGVATPNRSGASTQKGISTPAEAYFTAQPTASAQTDLIYSQNYPRLNLVARVRQPQQFDHRPSTSSPTNLNPPTEEHGTVRMGYTGSGRPTSALNGWRIASAPVQHTQLHTAVQPVPLAQAGGLQSLTPAGFNRQDHSSTRTLTHASVQCPAEALLPAQLQPRYAAYHTQGLARDGGSQSNGSGNPSKTRWTVPGRAAGERCCVEMQEGYPVPVYPAEPTGSSAPDGLTLGYQAQTLTSAPVHQHAPAESVNDTQRWQHIPFDPETFHPPSVGYFPHSYTNAYSMPSYPPVPGLSTPATPGRSDLTHGPVDATWPSSSRSSGKRRAPSGVDDGFRDKRTRRGGDWELP